MPWKPKSRCTKCKKLHPGTGLCPGCERAADRARGTAASRGYTGEHLTHFRPQVLARDPWCVICLQTGTLTPATVADHWPLSRRELVARGLDPNDPTRGRGLCKPCHDRETAHNQPGGWNKR